MRYACYGLTIDSELALTELTPAPEGGAAGPGSSGRVTGPPPAVGATAPPDVAITLSRAPLDRPAEAEQFGPRLWSTPRDLWLDVPGVARFLVHEGREILVEPARGTDEDSVRVFLLGSAFGALLLQRGLLVLHGNAIRVGNQCLLCVGASGAGKSTLAAAFLRRGHEILADDVVPVNDEGAALPGFPRIKLWRDVADHLGVDTTLLRRIRPQMEKFHYPVPRPGSDQPVPVRWIYVLESHAGAGTCIEPIRGTRRFEALHTNTYRMRFLRGLKLEPAHLKLCGLLASRTHLARVARPDRGFELDALVDAILADADAASADPARVKA